MKRIMIFMLTIICCISATAQKLKKEDYLRKSKNQKTIGWIFTGGGAALVIAGLITHESTQSYFPNEEVGTAMLATGGAAVVTGVIFFSASARNKKKAEETISIHMTFERSTAIQNASLLNHYYPALSVNIPIR